jgi:hypothetical protein
VLGALITGNIRGFISGKLRALAARRSCDLRSLTSSSVHSRASGIFPASRKARAFANASFSDDRSAADSFPGREAWALRSAAGVLRMVLIQLGFGGYKSLLSTPDRNVYPASKIFRRISFAVMGHVHVDDPIPVHR